MSFFTAPIRDVLQNCSVTQERGLTADQVLLSRIRFGKNISYLYKRKYPILVFLSQFSTPLIVVLLLVSMMSIFMGQIIDGSIIFAMLFINALVGTIQEMKAEKSLQRLSSLITNTCRVRRDGVAVLVSHEDVVCGDIVLLKTGDVIPADIRLLSSHGFSCNESVLTGEALPTYKESVDIEKGTQPQQLKGSVFMGASVVGGFGEGVVVATGKETFLGLSVNTRSSMESQTKFEKNMQGFSDTLFKFVLVFSGVTAAVNMFLGRDMLTSLMLGVMLALGITPEILPVIITIAMSRGAYQLSKKKVIIRRLSALEDLGNVDILCTDKTGTLTTGKIKVSEVLDATESKSAEVLELAFLCSAVLPKAFERTTENPLDAALVPAISENRRNELSSLALIDVSDFDFVSKRMLSLVVIEGKRILIRKGASELLLQHCSTYQKEGKSLHLTESIRNEILEKIAQYESRGLRIISIAKEYVDTVVNHVGDSKTMEYVGFITFEDPPRVGVDAELAELKGLAITTKIITGDSAAVTLEVAKKVGLHVGENDLVSGEDLEQLTPEMFSEMLHKKSYFVRTTPLQKLRIIQGLRDLGHTVAYMGDGINDVGALRAADVGISVNTATAVTKDVSDVILMQKTLSALGDAVQHGRKTFENTLKFILNTMSSSFGNVITAAVASFFLPFIPLLPKQLLLLDSLSDVQHLVFATDNVDEEQLKYPKVWNKRLIISFILVFGLLSTVFDFVHIAIFSSITTDATLFRTLWFVESIITEMFATFSIRTQRPMFKSRPGPALLLVTLGTLVFALVLPLLPYLSGWLGFTSLTIYQYAIVMSVVLSYIVVLEIVKQRFYKRLTKREESSL